jgi:predicted RNA binding protein YcfA (HicA-like mRNA interferase family)
VSQFPSMKGRELLRHLARKPLLYVEDPNRSRKGSHRTLVSPIFGEVLLGFHDRADIAPGLVRKVFVRDVGLSEEDALRHLRRKFTDKDASRYARDQR